jgi:ABC-type transport system involved in cytochrome c biogenesis permease subunit
LYLSFFIIDYFFDNTTSYYGFIFFSFFSFLNLPLLKFSVNWWNTMHQVSSFDQVYNVFHFSLFIPLLFCLLFFYLYYFYIFFFELKILFLYKKILFFYFLL